MPAFQIVRLEPGQAPEPVPDAIFATGQEAALVAEAWTLVADGGTKFQPRPLKGTTDWRKREAMRFEQGTYTLPIWANEAWAALEGTQDHFAHVSVKDPTKLAFTENNEKGEADVQTQMKPGRYLTKYFGHVLGETTIRNWALQWATLYETNLVKFTTDPDEIERVYVNGPRSCMSYAAETYESPFHPVRIYGESPDLALAWLTDEDENIVARCIVWPAKKRRSIIYGDDYRLNELLSREGYDQEPLEGARIKRVPRGERFVCPYIDEVRRVRDTGEWLMISENGELCAEDTAGHTFPPQSVCQRCDEHFDEEDARTVDGEDWCPGCYEYHAATCDATGHTVSEDNIVTLADGTNWSLSYYEDNGAQCEDCCDYFAADDLNADKGEHVCNGCLETRERDREDDESEADAEPAPKPAPVVELPGELSICACCNPSGSTFELWRTDTLGRFHRCVIDGQRLTGTRDWWRVSRTLDELSRMHPRSRYQIRAIAPQSVAA